MPVSIRAHLATQPDSVSLEDLAILADCALASENDAKVSQPGVAEIQVSESAKLIGLIGSFPTTKETRDVSSKEETL